MAEQLFLNIDYLKLCLKTLFEPDGLLSRRYYEIHKSFENLDVESMNQNNYFELIASSTNEKNKYLFIYFTNTSNFMSKTNKNKYGNLLDIKKKIMSLYELKSDDIDINMIVILTRPFKLNVQILEKKVIDKTGINNTQLFVYNSLLFNISKHSAIPKKVKVIYKLDDIESICDKKNISKEKLPKILITDPLAIFYGLKKGELFEFTRISQNSGEYIYYRLCTT
tara:strand:+ start:1895 stop:2566 length:672 start_codon:yes stop_codon:yes gene_type:complete